VYFSCYPRAAAGYPWATCIGGYHCSCHQTYPWDQLISCGTQEKLPLTFMSRPYKAILREHYPLPAIEEISTRLHGAKLFTTLDVRHEFWHIALSLLTTYYNTQFSRYRWKGCLLALFQPWRNNAGASWWFCSCGVWWLWIGGQQKSSWPSACSHCMYGVPDVLVTDMGLSSAQRNSLALPGIGALSIFFLSTLPSG